MEILSDLFFSYGKDYKGILVSGIHDQIQLLDANAYSEKEQYEWYSVLDEIINLKLLDKIQYVSSNMTVYAVFDWWSKYIHSFAIEKLPTEIITIENNEFIFHINDKKIHMGKILCDMEFAFLWKNEVNNIAKELQPIKDYIISIGGFENFEY